MPNFKKFSDAVAANFASLADKATVIYRTSITSEALYELYLKSFPAGSDPIYKTNTKHTCSTCRHFIKQYGNVVFVVDGKLVSFWALENLPFPYDIVANKLAEINKNDKIANIFVGKQQSLGIPSNRELLEDQTIKTWHHLHAVLPKKHVVNTKLKSPEAIMGDHRSNKDVFGRSMEELTLNAAESILELIEQNSIYRGQEFKANIQEFIKYKKLYSKLSESEKDIWVWVNSHNNFISRIRNTAMGTLLIDVSEGMDLDKAVGKFEKIMAPANYKRPTALITQAMIKEAEKKIHELGLSNSLGRRFATPEDISVENVLFVNRDVRPKMKGGIADILSPEVKGVSPKSFDKVQEVTVDKFLSDILPEAQSVEVMVENNHVGNFMSLIAPEDKAAPTMFKWNNNFSWVYNGDLADSMREEVKARGGNVDGPFRFTHSWNHDGNNQSLMDLHVFMPSNTHHPDHIKDASYGSNDQRVGWNHRNHTKSGGVQDIDYTAPPGKNIPIENISFPNLKKMPEGVYICKVHNWQARNPNTSGFKAEIEINGELYQYEYPNRLVNHEWVTVAEVTLKDGKFTIAHKLQPTSIMSKEIWGVKTNDFSKVSMITTSPNCWGERVIGNKHIFFVLDKCKSEGTPRGFFNEYLKEDLTPHKRVFEALGVKMKVPDSDNQLSGLGFSSTQNNSVVVRVQGKVKRMLKVIF